MRGLRRGDSHLDWEGGIKTILPGDSRRGLKKRMLGGLASVWKKGKEMAGNVVDRLTPDSRRPPGQVEPDTEQDEFTRAMAAANRAERRRVMAGRIKNGASNMADKIKDIPSSIKHKIGEARGRQYLRDQKTTERAEAAANQKGIRPAWQRFKGKVVKPRLFRYMREKDTPQPLMRPDPNDPIY